MDIKLADKLILPVALALIVSLVGAIAQATSQANAAASPEGVELPIIMYHLMSKEQAHLNEFTISPDEFRSDLQYLKNNGYTSIVMQDLIDYVKIGAPLPDKPVMITFDDGYESFHEYAYPLLREFGFKAVFSVVGRYVDKYSKAKDHHVLYSHCTWNQLALMQESGYVEIQNHSYNLHTDDRKRRGAMKNAGESLESYRKLLEDDLKKLQIECSENLGWAPTTFTYPFGLVSPESLPIIKELGFEAALTCHEKLNYITRDPEQLYRLKRFNRRHGRSVQSILEKAKR